jgi:hypothetical protein
MALFKQLRNISTPILFKEVVFLKGLTLNFSDFDFID